MTTKTEWGNACWFLFHTAAAKINENNIEMIRPLLDVILYVCRHLPCPVCSEHAINSFKLLRIEKINSKDKLIDCLLQFHNSVNSRTKKQHFTRAECDNKYNHLHLSRVFNIWANIMAKNMPGRNMLYSMSRNKMITDVKKFFIDNQQSFY